MPEISPCAVEICVSCLTWERDNCTPRKPVFVCCFELDRGPPKAAHVDEFVWYVGGGEATPFRLFANDIVLFWVRIVDGWRRSNVPVFNWNCVAVRAAPSADSSPFFRRLSYPPSLDVDPSPRGCACSPAHPLDLEVVGAAEYFLPFPTWEPSERPHPLLSSPFFRKLKLLLSLDVGPCPCGCA